MTVQLSNISGVQTLGRPLSQEARAPSHTSRVSKAYRTAEKGWSYGGKSLTVTRHVLNAGLRASLWGGKETTGKVQSIISRSKLFAALGVGFNLATFSTHVAKIRKNFERSDIEGLYLALLTFAILIGDTLDSLLTSINGAIETLALTPSQWIASIGLPLGFAIVSLGSLSRAVRLYHLHQASSLLVRVDFMKTSGMRPQDIHSAVTRFLKTLRLDDPKELAAIERHTTDGAAKLLKDLSSSLEKIDSSDEKNIAEVVETFHRIQRHLREEMAIQIAYGATNLLIFTSLCIFMVASVATALPYIILGTAWTARLLIQAYQDLQQDTLPQRAAHA
jgi:hypothetical protein